MIFFDVGGVIMPERNFKKVYKEFGEAIDLSPGISETLHRKYLRRLNHGMMSTDEFLSMFVEYSQSKRNLKKLWVDIAMRHLSLDKGTLKVVDRLSHRQSVVILSNTNELREIVDKKLGLYGHFDNVLLSNVLKMRKPNKNIFRYALRSAKAKPDEAIFIDDRERNLKTARVLGMRSILYKNDRQLAKELRAQGAVL